MIVLTVIILLFSFLFSSCGDDPPTKPPDPIPEGLSVVGGEYYKAIMGAVNDIEFVAVDANQSPVSNNWVIFSTLEGDGSFVNDSILTDSVGIALCQYSFSGNLGHAEVQALIRNVDSVSVTVRANTLIPGANGQGQYVLMEDTYADVKNFIGTPASIDLLPGYLILIANYEAALGVVVVFEDVNNDEILVDSAKIFEIIVNTIYTGKTKDSIGIGSTMADVIPIYNDSDITYYPSPAPPEYYIDYPASGISFWTNNATNFADRVISEIHLSKERTP